MKILFAHQNFPGQYLHLARQLAQNPENEVVFITQRVDGNLPGIRKIVYRPSRTVTQGVHHYLRETEAQILNAQAVARIALNLRAEGFTPDVMCAHNGWGESWYLKEVFPDVPLIGYFEFFYRAQGADVGFDKSKPEGFDTGPRVRSKNIGNLLGLDAVDWGQCPTTWQKSLYPERHHSMLHVVHEGIDTDVVMPNANAMLQIPDKELILTPQDEVVTYVARNLEPYRGFPSFMRSLPSILQKRPKAHVVVVGGDETSYGPASNGKTFRQQMLEELDTSLDTRRVHFLGKVPYSTFLSILQISSAHVYLTYPFVLSWSMLEAMAAGCLVIGSRTAPVEEVIRHGENGLLVNFFSPDDIAEKVIEVLGEPEAFQAIRQRARQTIINNYDLKRICLPAQLQLLKEKG